MSEQFYFGRINGVEAKVMDSGDLLAVIDRISFENSVMDFKWRFRIRETVLSAPLDQNTNKAAAGSVPCWLIWAEFTRPDVNPPHAVGTGRGRDEIIVQGTTVSGVVKTCWVLVEMLVKHELMEGFRFMSGRVFDPHASVFALMQASKPSVSPSASSSIISHPLTVGALRSLIQDMPASLPIVNDVVAGPDAYTACIVSVEAGTPDNWVRVEDVSDALWFHLQITSMENDVEDDDEDADEDADEGDSNAG